jgi:ribosomal protein L20
VAAAAKELDLVRHFGRHPETRSAKAFGGRRLSMWRFAVEDGVRAAGFGYGQRQQEGQSRRRMAAGSRPERTIHSRTHRRLSYDAVEVSIRM